MRTQSLELAHLFVLGVHLDGARFGNAVIDDFKVIALGSDYNPIVAATCYVWNRTSSDCQLRELFLQLWAEREDCNSPLPALRLKRIPHGFLVDLFVFARERHSKVLEEDSKRDRKSGEEKSSFHTYFDDSDKCN